MLKHSGVGWLTNMALKKQHGAMRNGRKSEG